MDKAQDRIFLNQVAQGLHDIDDAVEWFVAHTDEEQTSLLQELGYMVIQAGAIASDASPAAQYANVELGIPARVLMSNAAPREQVHKVVGLPKAERPRSFALLLGMLSIADRRRRENRCRGACRHWWHRDLGNPAVVEEIVSSGEAG